MPAALAQEELIGLPVTVVASGDAGLVGLRGTVVDETQRTFVVHTAQGEKTVAKPGQRFQFTRPDGRTEVLEGAALAYRPEERTKKAARPAARPKTRSTR